MMVMKNKNQDGLYKLEILTYLHKVLMRKRKFSKSHKKKKNKPTKMKNKKIMKMTMRK